METNLQINYAQGRVATFTGAAGTGVFYCSDILPLSVAWHLDGCRFNEVVTIDGPVGQWLELATITSADADDGGTTFQLEFPSGQD